MGAYPQQAVQGQKPPVQQPRQSQRQAPPVEDHPLMRRNRLDTLGTATSIIVAVEALVMFLWIIDSIMRSGASSSPLFLPIQSWIIPLWVMCTVINISLIVLHLVKLRWLEDEREMLWNVSNYANGVKAVIVVAIIFVIVFGYPPITKAIDDQLNKPESRTEITDFSQEFSTGDAFNIEYQYRIYVHANRSIDLAIHTKDDVDAHPNMDGTPIISINNTTEYTHDQKLKYGTYYLHMVASNETTVTYTIHKRVDPLLLTVFFWFPMVLMIANICYGVLLFREQRRAIRCFVSKEQAKLQSAFSIEEVFLIYRDGRLIAHNTRRLKADVDKDILTGMLTAVQNFVRESFQKDEDGILDEMHYGTLRIIIENGPHCNMAVVVSGQEPKDIRQRMKALLGEIHQTYGPYLAEWDGDTTALAECKKIIGEITPLPPPNVAKDPVQEVYLFHTDNRFIYHVTQRLGPDVDDDLLKETSDYIRDKVEETRRYNPGSMPHTLPYGESGWHILLEYGPDAYMAALLSGPEPRNFRSEMQNVLEEVHLNYGQILYNWNGEMDGLKDIKRILDGLFIRMHLAGRPGRR